MSTPSAEKVRHLLHISNGVLSFGPSIGVISARSPYRVGSTSTADQYRRSNTDYARASAFARYGATLRCGKAEHGGLTPGIGALVSKIPLGGLVHRADDTTDRPTDAGCKSERGVPDSSLERLSA